MPWILVLPRLPPPEALAPSIQQRQQCELRRQLEQLIGLRDRANVLCALNTRLDRNC